MAPLDQDARREGRKAMEKSLTAAARVRRRFKAGRPPRLSNQSPSVIEALGRVTREIGRAKDLMVDAGLSPDDINSALVLRVPDDACDQMVVHIKRIPAANEMGAFFSSVIEMASKAPVDFLGLLWLQQDREATGENESITWVTQFMGGDEANRQLLLAREHFRAGGGRALNN